MPNLFVEKLLLPVLICALTLNSWSQQVEKNHTSDSLLKKWDQTIPGSFSAESTLIFDSSQISAFYKRFPQLQKYSAQIKSFYRKRNYSFAWFQKGVLTEQAGNLSNRMLNLQNDGIYTQVPYQKALDSLFRGSSATKTSKLTNTTLELMLTSQYFIFSQLAWQGMNTSVSKSAEWYLPRKKVSYDRYLDSLLKSPTQQGLADEPVYRQYELLKNYLRKYRLLSAQDKWLPIVMPGKILRFGDSSLNILLIKKRLYKLEDYKGDTVSYLFNKELKTGVTIFQERHGLNADSIINKETLSEINIPLTKRIRQILVNMERSRWLPVKVTNKYIAVNIPEFKLHVYTGDSLLWSCNVVVGKAVRQTTVFSGEIKYVIFSPYWNVPEGIVRHEVIPGMKRNPNYLTALNMEITGHANGLPVVRQKPGPLNSLGLVKFLFPNSYNIYLHDTPSKSLFKEYSRAFSHGCIRVSEPAKLASFLLNDSATWNASKINEKMHSGTELSVTLTKTVPVFIAYFTAFTDRNNKMNFRKDIYNLDEKLASMIISGEGAY